MLAINHKNEVISINPNYHFLAFEKCWDPLMPYIMADPLEMGMYSIETNERFKAPFVWDNIKIISIEIDKTKEGYSHGFFPNIRRSDVYKIEVIIYPYHYWDDVEYKKHPHKSFIHTFYVKNGLFFFLDSILKTINGHINSGCSIDTINFDFLDKQCECWNFLAANDQPFPKFELPSESMPDNYYALIEDMDVVVYEDGIGSRNGDFIWKEVGISLKTNDDYVIHIVSEILSKYDGFSQIRNSVEKKTTFSFVFEKERDETSCCRTYSRRLVETSEQERIKRCFIKKLIVNGLSIIHKTSAIRYYSTKHPK
jgi:hypothetical protein